MAFVFRLERVLDVRRIEEDCATQRHTAAQERLRTASARLADFQERLHQCLGRLDDLKYRDELSEEALYLHSLHLAGLRQEIESIQAEVAALEGEVKSASDELLKAHRAREVLERLREREENSWRKAQAVREAKEMDEIAAMRSRAREEEKHGP